MSETLGSYIRIKRIGGQVSVTQLAKKLGVTSEAVKQIEDDKTRPDDTVLEDIAEMIGGDIDVMLRLRRSIGEKETRLRVSPIRKKTSENI